MKNKKKLNNKGFSLVELIIVVAIMAVLVGVLAPQYMKYVDRSKAGVDEQYADNIRSAMQTCLLDPNITVETGELVTTGTATDVKKPTASVPATDFWLNVYSILGADTTKDLEAELSLDNSTNADIEYKIDSNGKVTVTISGGKYTGTYAITVD